MLNLKFCFLIFIYYKKSITQETIGINYSYERTPFKRLKFKMMKILKILKFNVLKASYMSYRAEMTKL